jgi:hypothetical protein
MSLNDIIRVTVRFHINKMQIYPIDIRSKDAIYSTQAYASKKIKVWISDVLETNILGHAMVYVNKYAGS